MFVDRAPQRERSDESNDSALLLLGALRQLDRFAAAAESPAAIAGPDDALVTAALGLLSLRRSLRRWASHAAGEAQRDPTPKAPASQRRGALR